MKTLLLMLACLGLAFAQQQPAVLRSTVIGGITSSATVIDNRSTALRANTTNTFCATGTGTWSAQIQYSDGSTSGPWMNFSDEGSLVSNSSSSCAGVGTGYHDFIRFNISGTATVSYAGTKFIWMNSIGFGTSGVLSVFGRVGSVVATTGDYTAAQVTNAVDSTQTYSNPSWITALAWSKLTGIPSPLTSIANNTVLGNVSGITGAPTALTATQLTTLINPFTSSLSGAVPASGGGTVNYLRADGTFAAPPGGAFQANGTPLSSTTTINFLNSAATNGLTLTFTNPSAGGVQLGFTGTLNNAGLTNSSISFSVPSWLSINSPVSLGGTATLASATGLTSHYVIGTCGTATTISLCALVPGDIPTLNQNTTGTAANVTGVVARANGGLNSSSAGTGILRDGTTPAASELSVDATTSGSNAVTVVGVNGALVGASDGLVSTNASKQLIPATAHNPSVINACVAASGSATAYTCTTAPTFTPGAGDGIYFKADVANTGSATLNVNSTSAAAIDKQGGGTALAANDLLIGQWNLLIYSGSVWQMQSQTGNPSSGGGAIFSGATGGTVTGTAGAPVFSLAAVTSKSPTVFDFTITAAVTTPTITNLSAGAFATLNITSDGTNTHTWSWNSIITKGSACPIYTDAAATTTAYIWIDPDGTDIWGIGCVGGPSGSAGIGPTVSAPSTTPTVSGNEDCRYTANGIDCLYSDGTHHTTIKNGVDISAAGVVGGINSVPLCSGFSPTNGQAVEYTTGGSPNPCWNAVTPGGGSSPPPGTAWFIWGAAQTGGNLNPAAGSINGGIWFPWIAQAPTIKTFSLHVTTGASSGGGMIVGVFTVAAGLPTGSSLCTFVISGTNATSIGDHAITTSGGSLESGGVCSGLVVGGAYAVAMSADNTTMIIDASNLAEHLSLLQAPYDSLDESASMSTGTGSGIAFTAASGWAGTNSTPTGLPIVAFGN